MNRAWAMKAEIRITEMKRKADAQEVTIAELLARVKALEEKRGPGRTPKEAA